MTNENDFYTLSNFIIPIFKLLLKGDKAQIIEIGWI